MPSFVDRTVHVYLPRCADGAYYTGITRASPEERAGQHNAGTYGGYTARRRPVVLVWSEAFLDVRDAIACERRLKGWSRAKKEALIGGDWASVQALAKRRSGKPK